MDIGAIMYNYVWLGFVKLAMMLYSFGGVQFAIGVIIGVLMVIFGWFFKRMIIWILLVLVIASIGVGIYAADVDWKDIRDGNWYNKTTSVTQDQYQNQINQIPVPVPQPVVDEWSKI